MSVNPCPCRFRRRSTSVIAGMLLLAGCAAVGPDYAPPQTALPQRWHGPQPGAARAGAGPADRTGQMADWWRTLGDPLLSRLITRAAADNPDVREALSRVREARLQGHIARAPLFPALDVGASATRSGAGSGDTASRYTAALDAGWELDLFGAVRRADEAARADVSAEMAGLDDVRVTLFAEVVTNYIALRTYQARLAVAHRNVTAMRETWSLLDAQYRAGSGDALAVAQARYNLESAQAGIPDLTAGLAAAMHRLAVLTGTAAGTLDAELAVSRPLPRITAGFTVGVPADVLRQRPDIRQAERELAAQTARIGQAEADLYPRLSLSGSIGLEALSMGDLFRSASRVWSFGPAVSWSLFDAGATRRAVAIEIEQQHQALARYQGTVLAALEEVENALVAYAGEQRRLTRLEAAAAAARLAVDLADTQYTTGLTDFSDVLDAQRSLLSFEDQLVESRGAVLSDIVQLYKALGGGWQSLTDTDGGAAAVDGIDKG